MKFGFVIDNRKCIGCHACTVACKSEHDVPIGVNRTWVKQTEKGEFPNTRRVFSVLRCNHCTDAPCVEICPVEALYIREDGIVDFNNDRCIGCKSCMQACPYDALYIDPDTHTAAKCNYCAHRIDVGLEPACVNVCPEHAIISGDVEDPNSEIAQLIAREQVTVRKPEKATQPNVYYINGDAASLTPSMTDRSSAYIWGSQKTGVGHYARYMEGVVASKSEKEMEQILAGETSAKEITYAGDKVTRKSIEVLMENASKNKRVYDTPDKGILWGWEVAAYVLTKAIASGGVIVLFLALLMNPESVSRTIEFSVLGWALFFMMLTGALLVKDLDQPKRFLYVLFRPQWKSWLAKGGYAITFFGGFTTLWIVAKYFQLDSVMMASRYLAAITAVVVAVYTAFLFAQAKGRDFWQSPTLVLHMFVHGLMAGAGLVFIISAFAEMDASLLNLAKTIMLGSIIVNLSLMLIELTITHPTQDAKTVVIMIISGRYRRMFWAGAIFIGNILPLAFLVLFPTSVIPAALVWVGVYLTEKIWVEAPQRIPLT